MSHHRWHGHVLQDLKPTMPLKQTGWAAPHLSVRPSFSVRDFVIASVKATIFFQIGSLRSH